MIAHGLSSQLWVSALVRQVEDPVSLSKSALALCAALRWDSRFTAA